MSGFEGFFMGHFRLALLIFYCFLLFSVETALNRARYSRFKRPGNNNHLQENAIFR